MKKNPTKVITTHIHTLSDNTPKSRRRVRALLGLTKETVVTPNHVAAATAKASTAERTFNTNAEKKKRR